MMVSGIPVLTLLVFLIIDLIRFPIHIPLRLVLLPIVYVAFYVAGGIFCLRRRYWPVCLASASFVVFIEVIPPVVDMLPRGYLLWGWDTWLLVIGGFISTVLISVGKKEWSESQA